MMMRSPGDNYLRILTKRKRNKGHKRPVVRQQLARSYRLDFVNFFVRKRIEADARGRGSDHGFGEECMGIGAGRSRIPKSQVTDCGRGRRAGSAGLGSRLPALV